MRDTLSIACTPLDEPCVQVSQTVDYSQMMSREVRAFKNMLERMAEAGTFGKQGRSYFKVESNPHEFGTYKEVAVAFSDDDADGEAFAYSVEGNIPLLWDDEARKELGDDYFEFVSKQNVEGK